MRLLSQLVSQIERCCTLGTDTTLDSDIGVLAKGYAAPGYSETTQSEETEKQDSAPAADVNLLPADVTEIEAGTEPLTISEPTPNGLANGNDLSISQEWVDVKALPEPVTATVAAPVEVPSGKSWADDQPEVASVVSKLSIIDHLATQTKQHQAPSATPAQPNDGFHQVQRNRGRHEREGSGNFRGRGRGAYRGQGARGGRGGGDGRGRGRDNRNPNSGGAAPRPLRQENQ